MVSYEKCFNCDGFFKAIVFYYSIMNFEFLKTLACSLNNKDVKTLNNGSFVQRIPLTKGKHSHVLSSCSVDGFMLYDIWLIGHSVSSLLSALHPLMAWHCYCSGVLMTKFGCWICKALVLENEAYFPWIISMGGIDYNTLIVALTLQWRHDGRDGVSNHRRFDCLLNRLFRHRSKNTSTIRVTGLCVGNWPVTGEFPAQMASNAENVSIWWRHHGLLTSNRRQAAVIGNIIKMPIQTRRITGFSRSHRPFYMTSSCRPSCFIFINSQINVAELVT